MEKGENPQPVTEQKTTTNLPLLVSLLKQSEVK
jgi:hypothetical protein